MIKDKNEKLIFMKEDKEHLIFDREGIYFIEWGSISKNKNFLPWEKIRVLKVYNQSQSSGGKSNVVLSILTKKEDVTKDSVFVVHKNLILIEDLDVGWEKAIMDIKNYLVHKAILLQGDFWSKPTSDQLMDNNELYLDGFNKEDIVALYKSKKDVQQGFYAFLMVVVVFLVLVYIFKK